MESRDVKHDETLDCAILSLLLVKALNMNIIPYQIDNTLKSRTVAQVYLTDVKLNP